MLVGAETHSILSILLFVGTMEHGWQQETQALALHSGGDAKGRKFRNGSGVTQVNDEDWMKLMRKNHGQQKVPASSHWRWTSSSKETYGVFGRRGSSNQQYLALQRKAETPNQKAVIMCT